MKIKIIIKNFALLFIGFAMMHEAKAQPYRYAMKMNMNRMIFESTFQMSFERVMGPNFSTNLSLSGTYGNSLMYGYYDEISGVGIEFEPRFYPMSVGKMPKGFFLAPTLMFRYFWLVDDYWWYPYPPYDDNAELNVFFVGVIMGHQFVIGKIMSLELYFGGGLRLSKYAGENNFAKGYFWDVDYSGITPRLGLNVGIVR